MSERKTEMKTAKKARKPRKASTRPRKPYVKKKAPEIRVRNFAMTYYGVMPPGLDHPIIRFIQGVQEICPDTGKLHWQCCFFTTISVSWQSICDHVTPKWPGAHIEITRKSFATNRKYCTLGKGLTPPDTSGVPGIEFSLGMPPAPGTRNDLDTAIEQILTGGPKAILDKSVYVRYHHGLDALRRVHAVAHDGPKTVRWFWGDTRFGKSRTVYAENPGIAIYKQSSSNGWFDGYNGQKIILIDDYDKGAFTQREMNNLLDAYPMDVKVKGAMEPCQAHTIYITSHYQPEYYFEPERYPEIEGRLTEIRHFTCRQYPAMGGGVSITSTTSPLLLSEV